MKKIVDDWRLIYKVCSLYYEDDMRQQEVSDYLGISRATVSRMLQKGKESGIVRVEVINPVQFSYNKLEKALERKYGLKEVIVVESSALDTKTESVSRMYERAALYLSQFFKDGDWIGVTMGHTLHNIVKTNWAFEKDKKLMFVPIVGGIGQSTIEKAMEYFLKEKSISYIFDDFQKLDTLIMGIGIPQRVESTLVRAGYITGENLEEFAQDGVAGDIALHFFDEDGGTEKFRAFNDRVAGMPLEMMKKVRNRIGIAGGENRAEAIRGAIKGGFINMLITNIDAAEKLL